MVSEGTHICYFSSQTCSSKLLHQCLDSKCLKLGPGPMFVWHDPPTALDKIPEDVTIAFAVKLSTADARVNSSSNCQQPTCNTAAGRPRKANMNCTRNPACCRPCCSLLGGCTTHRLTGAPASQILAPSQIPIPQERMFEEQEVCSISYLI